MKFVRVFLVTFSLLSAPIMAQAGILLEPYLSYEMGKFEGTQVSKIESDLSGVGFGARLGYTMPFLMVGVDYSATNGKDKQTVGGSAENDATRTSLYAFVGARLPVFRVWAGYGFMNDLTLKPAGADEVKFSGPAVKVGLSYTGIPFVALNAEYAMSTYNKFKSGALEEDISATGTVSSAKMNSVLVSLSVPFNL